MEGYSLEEMTLMQDSVAVIPVIFRHILLSHPRVIQLQIPQNQMLALLTLHRYPGCNMTQLAGYLNIAKQQLTKIVDSLVEKELVSRTPAQYNRRAMMLELTEQGKQLMEEVLACQAEQFAKLFSASKIRQRKAVISALTLLREGWEKQLMQSGFPRPVVPQEDEDGNP